MGSFGGTAGFLSLERPPFDQATNTNGVSTLLLATWNQAAQGFSVTAQDTNGSPLGTTQVVANTYQVDLRSRPSRHSRSSRARPRPTTAARTAG